MAGLQKWIQKFQDVSTPIVPDEAIAAVLASRGRPIGPSEVVKNERGSFSRSNEMIAPWAKTDDEVARELAEAEVAAKLAEARGAGGNSPFAKINAEGLQKLTDERDKASKWLGLADQAEGALEETGDTGTIPGWAGWAASGIPGDPFGQRPKLAADAKLDALQAEAIGLARVPGSGPLSDKDMAKLMAGIPTSEKLKGQNSALVGQIRGQRGQERDMLNRAIALVQQGVPVEDARRMAGMEAQPASGSVPLPGETREQFIQRMERQTRGTIG